MRLNILSERKRKSRGTADIAGKIYQNISIEDAKKKAYSMPGVNIFWYNGRKITYSPRDKAWKVEGGGFIPGPPPAHL